MALDIAQDNLVICQHIKVTQRSHHLKAHKIVGHVRIQLRANH